MPATLENCLNEDVEEIIHLLDLDSIRALRQTSRSLASKCAQRYFRTFYQKKCVQLRRDVLEEFVAVTKDGGLACNVRELVVLGHYDLFAENYHDGGYYAQWRVNHLDVVREGDIELLGRAFEGIKKGNKDGKLEELVLEVVCRGGTDEPLEPGSKAVKEAKYKWEYLSQAAGDVFLTVAQALARSRLPVEKISLFYRGKPIEVGGALGCEYLGKVDWGDEGLATCFAGLLELSIRVSNRVILAFEKWVEDEDELLDIEEDGSENDEEEEEELTEWGAPYSEHDGFQPPRRPKSDLKAEALDEINFTGLANLLRLCPRLKTFNLHYFRHRNRFCSHLLQVHHERLFQRIVELNPPLPNLQSCILRGICAREELLLAFLTSIQTVRALSLEGIYLSSGSYKSIFSLFINPKSVFSKLFLDDLFEGGRLILFDGPGLPKFPIRGVIQGSHTLAREGENSEARYQIGENNIKRSILYSIPRGEPIASPYTDEWNTKAWSTYGE